MPFNVKCHDRQSAARQNIGAGLKVTLALPVILIPRNSCRLQGDSAVPDDVDGAAERIRPGIGSCRSISIQRDTVAAAAVLVLARIE